MPKLSLLNTDVSPIVMVLAAVAVLVGVLVGVLVEVHVGVGGRGVSVGVSVGLFVAVAVPVETFSRITRISSRTPPIVTEHGYGQLMAIW